MRERFERFMQGRYGVDPLVRFTLSAALVMIVLSFLLVRVPVVGSLFNFLGILGIVYTYFRMFSKNISARYDENRKFLEKTAGLRRKLNREKNLMNERKINHIYTCPGCKAKLRAPKGKGKIEITCPKCHTKFVKRS
ncbi:MAG: hypothetical protein IJX90_03530 [Blautia sp.]|nr:hypothetical protein [Blautia sp.]